MTSRLKIICFAGAPYDAPTWTNRQHVMTCLAKLYPVLYVEPRVWIVRAVRRFLARRWRPTMQHQLLYVVSQWNALPGSRELTFIAQFNHALNRWFIKRQAQRLGFVARTGQSSGDSALVVWLYDTEAAAYLASFPQATVVYDCVDDHAAQAGMDRNPQRVVQEEAAILQRADLVTVSSRRLFALKRANHPNIHLVLNAGDVVKFEHASGYRPVDLDHIPLPIIGTVGTLDAYKVDFELVRAVAKARPQWQFVLIGSPIVDAEEARRSGLKQLAALANVHLLGPRSRHLVPAYVANFDVCMIPYRNSRYNAASFPLKFWEFMAAGKPIVAAGVPELKAYRDYISYAERTDEFVAGIERALAEAGEDARDREVRRALAREHSWEKRTERLRQLMNETLTRNLKRTEI